MPNKYCHLHGLESQLTAKNDLKYHLIIKKSNGAGVQLGWTCDLSVHCFFCCRELERVYLK
jgi:hypothetical protein